MNEPSKFWFPRKKYGWGWGLANCWQGLLVQGGYIVLVILGGQLLLIQGQGDLFWILFAILTLAFVAIHWLKGEKHVPRDEP